MIRFILSLFLCSIALTSSAQPMMKDSVDISVLSAQDQAKIKSMRTKLNLSEQQDLLIPSIYLYYHGLIEEQKAIMNTIADEPKINDEARLEALNMRSDAIKRFRDERDLNIELALTPEQKESEFRKLLTKWEEDERRDNA
jgi:parvulin-like peptidyl-prolyl isomerase